MVDLAYLRCGLGTNQGKRTISVRSGLGLYTKCGFGTNQGGSWRTCDARVKERYMNELKSHPVTKKYLQEMKVALYTNKVHLHVSEDKAC